jgi:predicted dehydrogenase
MRLNESNRRDFLKVSGVAAGAAAFAAALPAVHAAGDESIRVGLIGCGGRGRGAALDCLRADKAVKIVAVGDVFEEQARGAARQFQNNKEFAGRVDIGDRVFSGLDNYQKVIDSGVDLVLLATPPGFRPAHLEAAITAGKHVFTEKPVAVDGPGIRKCLALVDEAKKRNLAVVAGTQRRHQAGYIETIKQIQDGAIGDIVSARCSWNQGNIWFRKRKPDQSGAEYQIWNWYHFVWTCGDHIVEQHVHNLDVINWILGKHPVRASGMGGRQGGPTRPAGDPREVGHIFDHFAVEYEYDNGVRMYSFCRQIDGCDSDVSETVFGTKGSSRVNAYQINRKKVFDGDEISPYVQEHINLIASIRQGKPLNELQAVTESTLTAIMGRMATYTGRAVTWEQALNSKENTMPAGLTLSMDPDVPPVAVPGQTKFV